MSKKGWLAVAVLALCALGLVACGGGGSGSGRDKSVSDEEAALEFTECLRAHGVEVEDPKPGQKNIEVGGPGDPASRKALAACNGKLGSSGQELSAEEDEEFREGALALAQCMREEGIEMGDPEFLGPGKFHLDIAGIDTSSPAFKAAQAACGDKLPELSGPTVGG
jgi:predicted small secreted protein